MPHATSHKKQLLTVELSYALPWMPLEAWL